MDFVEIGKKWQKFWKENKTYKITEDKNKKSFYILDMFPYPSGAGLHVGHPKGYIATDVIARKHMLQGESVLHPMGFDTFGLGTEQYAIANKMKPQVAAAQNIATYKKQLEMFGCTYDWDREVNTADPKYFKWTQKTFLDLYNSYFDEETKSAKPIADLELKIDNGGLIIPDGISKNEFLDSQRLAYMDYKPINWCPHDKTVLANEDLDGNGCCERCGTQVEQKPMKQRIIRITKYAERLLEGLEKLPEWTDSAREQQRNWIGKSEGTQFSLEVRSENLETNGVVEVYTTRVDTVFGMSFVVMAPEHKLVESLKLRIDNGELRIENWDEIQEYIEKARHKTQLERTELQKEKTGVILDGVCAINPFNGEKVPIYIGDYVLANYGTGVVMAVPAHDERDFEFAKKYEIKVKDVVVPFIELSGVNAPKNEKNTYKFSATTSIIKHRDEDKYLLLKRKNGQMGFVGGGIEDGETKEETMTREIKEETGYQNFKIISNIIKNIQGVGFKEWKDHNSYAYDSVFYVELTDGNKVDLSDLESTKHDVVRLSKKDVENHLTLDHHLYYWKYFIENNGSQLDCFTEKGILIDSGEFSGMTSEQAIDAMNKWLEKKGIGGKKINYRLQDWVFSRQRYRGEPIPMIHCDECGIVPLQEKDLPLELPDVENYEPTGTEEGPLADIDDWINVKCPKCGGDAKRESNTMPGWAGSSWYWMRYMDPHNDKELVSSEKEKFWHPVDIYVGGAEHITRHMIYARFWHKFLQDLGTVSVDEPFKRYQHVGLIMAEDGRKMSKRRGNVINPDDIINEFGPDTLRMYEMFMGPFDQAVNWNTNGVKGVKKFLEKVVKLYDKVKPHPNPLLKGEGIDTNVDDKKTFNLLHKTIKKVTEDIDTFGFNTAISQMMILVNELTTKDIISKDTFEKLIILLAPFAPHLAEELWESMGNQFSIFNQNVWPQYDPQYLIDDTVTIAVQINGKVRGTIEISTDDSQEKVLELVKKNDKINKYLDGEIVKTIYIPSKICNIIVKS